MTRPFADQSVRTLSTITGYISSIKFFCVEENVELSKDCCNWIAKFIEGYKRVIADLKDKGIMKNYEGKVPITLATYSKLCGIALFAAEQRARSAHSVHSFMILCWNLFARSNSVAGLRTHHLCWVGDALVVDMSKQKADQTGEKITPKHVYANPFRPEMCPILALALQIFSTSFRPENENKSLIFLGNSYDVFQSWLQVAVSALNELGLKVEDFGTHSFRKGIATYAAGFIGGPSIIAIFLRAGWSLGQVHDRYLTYADGGDQFCGRVACGLSMNDGERFAVLPPHFESSDVISHEEWQVIAPGYDQYPGTFQTCLNYFLASLVFHLDWITATDSSGRGINVPNNHPIFQSRLFTHWDVAALKTRVLPLNCSGRCEKTAMTATGIPPSIDLARQLGKMAAENAALIRRLQAFEESLMRDLPLAITQNLKENIQIEGLHQMSRNDLNHCISEALNAHMERWSLYARNGSESGASNSSCGEGERLVEGALLRMTWNGYSCWYWKGEMGRPVPLSFIFPLGAVKVICDLFMYGIASQNIRPFRFIKSPRTLLRQHHQYFSKSKAVFNTVIDTITVLRLAESITSITSLNVVDWDNVFGMAFMHLIEQFMWALEIVIHKPGELVFLRFYDLYKKYAVLMSGEV